MVAVLLLGLVYAPNTTEAAPAQIQFQRGQIVEPVNQVEFTRPPAAPVPARPAQPLYFGDRVETFDASWASLRFEDNFILTLRELSVLEIRRRSDRPEQPQLWLPGGLFHLSRFRKAEEVPVRTPQVAVIPKGTEFIIRVTPAATEITMLHGSARLANALGELEVGAGDQAVTRTGEAPKLVPLQGRHNVMQWWIYYPAVIVPADLNLGRNPPAPVQTALEAYRRGNLPEAIEALLMRGTRARLPEAKAQRDLAVFRSALQLAAGKPAPPDRSPNLNQLPPLRRALAILQNAVIGRCDQPPPEPQTASEWLAWSYFHQCRHQIPEALEAARTAVELSPDFGPGWARVAELEFGLGRLRRSQQALELALRLAPDHAPAHTVQGFIHANANRVEAAKASFRRAIQLKADFADGHLGLGLCLIRQGDRTNGVHELELAAHYEPERAVLYSYLGKGYQELGDFDAAREALARAKALDDADPTPWLYGALLERDDNRINPSVRQMEQSVARNDNRRVYRSRFLLDRDRAVRSSSLARLYLDAGMADASLREAARAVGADYANYSAHQFVADSFNALRDPTRFNLRFETAWFNEWLLANLLAPVGGTPLSQNISQQEYSRLFERDRLGLVGSTEYRSDRQFRTVASQFGRYRNTSYALDLDYQRNGGIRPNNELDRLEWYATIKHQITPQDSALLLMKYQDFFSGDNFQYYNPKERQREHFQFEEFQHPILMGGFHREWAPGIHTLLLGGRLENDQRFSDLARDQRVIWKLGGQPLSQAFVPLDVTLRGQLEIYTADLQQIFDTEHHTLVLGGRFQTGEFDTRSWLDNPQAITNKFSSPAANQSSVDGFQRGSAYAYYTLKLPWRMALTAGGAFDDLTYPRNFRVPPTAAGEAHRQKWSPKAALVWSPWSAVTLRGVYTRALGGASLDESYRLEPVQLAGFSQAFRTLIPESVVGSVAGPEYETAGGALDLKFPTGTYAGVQGEWLRSRVRQTIGVFDYDNFIDPNARIEAGGAREELDFEEIAIGGSVDQLLGQGWSIGAGYRFSRTELWKRHPDWAGTFFGAPTLDRAELQIAQVRLLYNHPSGFFGGVRSRWFWQHNAGVSAGLADDHFAQVDLHVGFRLPRRNGELSLGVLNLNDTDYRLNPLNLHAEYPRDRTVVGRVSFRF